MDGPAAASPIAAAELAGAITFGIAGPDDDPDVRRLLRDNPMPGRIRVSLEREPNSSFASAIEGDVHGNILAWDSRTGRAVASGGYAVREMYVNGKSRRVGYLGQLRIDRKYRGRRSIILGGYKYLQQLHEGLNGFAPVMRPGGRATPPAAQRERRTRTSALQDETQYKFDADPPEIAHDHSGPSLYLTSIISENRPAWRLLEAGLPGMPVYRALEEFVTVLLRPTSPSTSAQCDASIQRGSIDRIDEIVDCLSRNGRRHQFATRWTKEILRSPERVRELKIENFLIAIRAGRIVGCSALWDQRPFKQAVIRGYDRATGFLRPLLNLVSPLTRMARLPKVDAAVEQCYLSHIAVDDDDSSVFEALVSAALGAAADCRFDYLVFGLAARHPLLYVARRAFGCREYRSMIYLVHWDDGAGEADAIDGRIPHPEVALL